MPRSTRSKESGPGMFFSNPRNGDVTPTMAKTMALPRHHLINNSMDAALESWPFFGGEDPEENPTDPPEKTPAGPPSTADGDEKPLLTNAEINAILEQVKSQGTKITALTKENENFKKNETKASRANLGKEEAMQKDLDDANSTIEGLKKALKNQALTNAIQGNETLKFESVKHVIREIDNDMLEFDIDLEKGVATVTGIETELKRIAKEYPWMMKKADEELPVNNSGNGNLGRPPVRPSGGPAAPGNGNNEKQTRRADLMARFPVIAHGRG